MEAQVVSPGTAVAEAVTEYSGRQRQKHRAIVAKGDELNK